MDVKAHIVDVPLPPPYSPSIKIPDSDTRDEDVRVFFLALLCALWCFTCQTFIRTYTPLPTSSPPFITLYNPSVVLYDWNDFLLSFLVMMSLCQAFYSGLKAAWGEGRCALLEGQGRRAMIEVGTWLGCIASWVMLWSTLAENDFCTRWQVNIGMGYFLFQEYLVWRAMAEKEPETTEEGPLALPEEEGKEDEESEIVDISVISFV